MPLCLWEMQLELASLNCSLFSRSSVWLLEYVILPDGLALRMSDMIYMSSNVGFFCFFFVSPGLVLCNQSFLESELCNIKIWIMSKFQRCYQEMSSLLSNSHIQTSWRVVMEVGRSLRLGKLLKCLFLCWTIFGLPGSAGTNFKFHKEVLYLLGPVTSVCWVFIVNGSVPLRQAVGAGATFCPACAPAIWMDSVNAAVVLVLSPEVWL